MATCDFSRRPYSTDFAVSEENRNIITTFTSIACQCILYGVQLTLTVFAGHTLLFVHTRSKATMWLLLPAIVMFASSTIYVVFSLEIAMNYTNPFFDEKSTLEDTSRMGEALLYLSSVNYMCSDVILFWRAYVLWTTDRRVFILPASLLVGSLGTILVSIGSKGLTEAGSLSGQDLALSLIYSSWVLTLAANVVLTFIIGFKAWQYSRFSTIPGLGRKSSRSAGVKVIITMVESGAVYCVFLMSLVIMNFHFLSSGALSTGNISMGGSVIQDISVQISAIYPTIIIVIVALRRSIADTAPTNISLPSFVARNRNITASASITPAHTQSHALLERQSDSDGQSNILVVGFGASQKSGEAENTGEA